jgi:hypothetical protein
MKNVPNKSFKTHVCLVAQFLYEEPYWGRSEGGCGYEKVGFAVYVADINKIQSSEQNLVQISMQNPVKIYQNSSTLQL